MNFNHRNKKELPYISICIIGCCINPLDEWFKWLLYHEEKTSFSKRIEEMTLKEINKYKEELEKVKMAELVFKYRKKECTKDEHDLVYNYLMNHSIEQLMESKMSKEELKQAKKLLAELKKLSPADLKNYIEGKNSNYDHLSKIDAYVLHYISIYNYQRTSEEATKKIIDLNKRKELNLRKSLHKDYGYFSKK